jgi:hypothetical protein
MPNITMELSAEDVALLRAALVETRDILEICGLDKNINSSKDREDLRRIESLLDRLPEVKH